MEERECYPLEVRKIYCRSCKYYVRKNPYHCYWRTSDDPFKNWHYRTKNAFGLCANPDVKIIPVSPNEAIFCREYKKKGER